MSQTARFQETLRRLAMIDEARRGATGEGSAAGASRSHLAGECPGAACGPGFQFIRIG
jgi:hypothetical protein